jgi:hypothetical protein
LEHAASADVLVEVWPVHTFAIAHDFEVLPLLRGGLRQSPRPSKRYGYQAPIGKVGGDHLVIDFKFQDARITILHSAPLTTRIRKAHLQIQQQAQFRLHVGPQTCGHHSHLANNIGFVDCRQLVQAKQGNRFQAC